MHLLFFHNFCNQNYPVYTFYQNLELNYYFENPESIKSTRITKALDKIQKHNNERVVLFSCFKEDFEETQHHDHGFRVSRSCWCWRTIGAASELTWKSWNIVFLKGHPFYCLFFGTTYVAFTTLPSKFIIKGWFRVEFEPAASQGLLGLLIIISKHFLLMYHSRDCVQFSCNSKRG